mgnify:FL=1
MQAELIDVIYSFVPQASFRINNNSEEYSAIIWLDTDNYTVPTETEFNERRSILTSQLPLKIYREIREVIFMETDKYALPDFPHQSEEIRQSWLDYRQSLRDLPSTQNPTLNEYGELINITWPTDPNGRTGPP